jgi:hypothetical protein
MTPDRREENAREFVRRVEQRLLEADAAGEDAGSIRNVTNDQEREN